MKIKGYKLIVTYEDKSQKELWDFPNGMNEDLKEWIKIINKNEEFRK